MMKFKSLILLLMLCLSGFIAQAQEGSPEMADVFRESGKIYVVITVMALVFGSAVTLLVIIERRLKKLEDKLNTKA